MKRKLTITLMPTSGTINRFYAFVGSTKAIARDGDKVCTWQGTVEDMVHIRVRAHGIGKAEYTIKIDLPDTAHDRSVTFSLDGGYHEAELTI